MAFFSRAEGKGIEMTSHDGTVEMTGVETRRSRMQWKDYVSVGVTLQLAGVICWLAAASDGHRGPVGTIVAVALLLAGVQTACVGLVAKGVRLAGDPEG